MEGMPAGGKSGPSAKSTVALVFGALGGKSGPSPKATATNDMINSATARTRFMVFLLIDGGCPRETV